MVGKQALLVVVRLIEVGLKMCFYLQRALSGFSERIYFGGQVSADCEVVDFLAEEVIFAEGVPFEVFLVLQDSRK